MPHSLLQTHPLLRISCQQLRDEVLHLCRQVAGELDVHGQNLAVGLLPALLGLERSMASAELVAKHPNAPDVNHEIVLIAQDDLGRDIVKSAAESSPF